METADGVAHPQQILGEVGVWEAGGGRGGPPDDGSGQVEESHVTVEGVGVEMRMDEGLLDLDELLPGIRTPFIVISYTHTRC